METGFWVLVGGAAFSSALVLGLLVHHFVKHGRPGRDYIEHRGLRLFTPSDVCSASHSHEKYEVVYAVVGTILLVLAYVLYT